MFSTALSECMVASDRLWCDRRGVEQVSAWAEERERKRERRLCSEREREEQTRFVKSIGKEEVLNILVTVSANLRLSYSFSLAQRVKRG